MINLCDWLLRKAINLAGQILDADYLVFTNKCSEILWRIFTHSHFKNIAMDKSLKISTLIQDFNPCS
jgi:hypothetical protein